MSAHPKPRLEQDGDVTIVVFGAGLRMVSEEHMPDVGETMLTAAEREPPLVVLDMDGVEFFGSSFIELMFRLWNRLNKRQGRFTICNLFPYCREILKVTNLDTLWKVCGTRAEALAWVRKSGE